MDIPPMSEKRGAEPVAIEIKLRIVSVTLGWLSGIE
jgi:hypothetical protein